MENKIVFTTAFVFEVDLVKDLFKKEHIPFYIQTENLAGVRSAFPLSPSSGLGMRYHIFVPKKIATIAKEKLSLLHLSSHSDKIPFPIIDPKMWGKIWLKIAILIIPFIILLGWALYSALKNNSKF